MIIHYKKQKQIVFSNTSPQIEIRKSKIGLGWGIEDDIEKENVPSSGGVAVRRGLTGRVYSRHYYSIIPAQKEV